MRRGGGWSGGVSWAIGAALAFTVGCGGAPIDSGGKGKTHTSNGSDPLQPEVAAVDSSGGRIPPGRDGMVSPHGPHDGDSTPLGNGPGMNNPGTDPGHPNGPHGNVP